MIKDCKSVHNILAIYYQYHLIQSYHFLSRLRMDRSGPVTMKMNNAFRTGFLGFDDQFDDNENAVETGILLQKKKENPMNNNNKKYNKMKISIQHQLKFISHNDKVCK